MPYDEAWQQLIKYTSSRFFAIDNYEKESGLMTLSFSPNPTRSVDCGYIETDGPPSYEGPYLERFQETPNREADLDSGVNLTVAEVSDSKTKVEVNTR